VKQIQLEIRVFCDSAMQCQMVQFRLVFKELKMLGVAMVVALLVGKFQSN
jgi:hypothetical protein